MRDAVTDVDTLFDLLSLPRACHGPATDAARLFGLRVPRSYVARIQPGDIHDPLLRQILPIGAERNTHSEFVADAVGDLDSAAGHGLLHKYHGRALLITTGACAVHCRYCFRRHFDYAAQHAGGSHTARALAQIREDSSIEEVILSGGDPLSLDSPRLNQLGEALDAIEHVKRVRIHTRTAVALPERVNAPLLAWISARRARVIVVVHVNHAHEIDDTVATGLRRMRQAGATLLNQAVLLAGVNDSAAAQIALNETLFAADVLPYYLHLLDRVAGTRHFEVDEDAATRLMQTVAASLPGYLVPRLAREEPGTSAKSVRAVPARPVTHRQSVPQP